MPESYLHQDVKSDLYWSIKENESYAEVEKKIGHTCTDILTEINDHLVAIEIQHTRIPIKSILRRMREHTKMGAYTLWLITPDALKHDETFVKNLNWVMFIQRLQNGIIFLPFKEHTILPARVDNSLKFKKNNEITAGRKILDTHEPVDFKDLSFYSHCGLNIISYDTVWWISEDVQM